MIIFAAKVQSTHANSIHTLEGHGFFQEEIEGERMGINLTIEFLVSFSGSEREFKLMRGNVSIYFSLFLSTLIHLYTFASLYWFTITNYYN